MASSSSSSILQGKEEELATLKVKKHSIWGFFAAVVERLEDRVGKHDRKETQFFLEVKDNITNASNTQETVRSPTPRFLTSKVCSEVIKSLEEMFETDQLLAKVEKELEMEKREVEQEEYIDFPLYYAILFWYMTQFANSYSEKIGQRLFGISEYHLDTQPLFEDSEELLRFFFPFIAEGTKLTLHLFWLIVNRSYFAFTKEILSYDEKIYISSKSTFFINLFLNIEKKNEDYRKKVKEIVGNAVIMSNDKEIYLPIPHDFFISGMLDRKLRGYVSLWAQTRDTIHVQKD